MNRRRSAWSHCGAIRAERCVCLWQCWLQSCPSNCLPSLVPSAVRVAGQVAVSHDSPLGIWFASSVSCVPLAHRWNRYVWHSVITSYSVTTPPFFPFSKAHLAVRIIGGGRERREHTSVIMSTRGRQRPEAPGDASQSVHLRH